MNIIESYEVNGKLYVTAKFLSAYFNKSAKQISRWKQDGMPTVEKQNEINIRGDVFFLKDCVKWVSENINSTKSRATNRRGIGVDLPPEDKDIEETVNDINGKIRQANEMLQLKTTSHEDADRIKKILDGLVQAVKLGEQTKELIPKKDTEKVIVEFIVTLISGYKRDIKNLPKECEKRNEKEIREILEKTYKANIEKYKKMTKSKIESEAKLYDIIEVVVDFISNGISTDNIIKRIKTE